MKQILIGCLVVFVLCVAGSVVAVVLLFPHVKGWFEGELAKENDRQQLANGWQPPVADVKDEKALLEMPADTLFPTKVGNDTRQSTDDNAAIPDLGISHKGRHAVYTVGADSVDVYAYWMNEAEKQAIFTVIQSQYDKGKDKSGNRRYSILGYRAYFESPEVGQNHLWHLKGQWLFVFRTKATDDKEAFVMDYLKAISSEGKPKPKDKEDANKNPEKPKEK